MRWKLVELQKRRQTKGLTCYVRMHKACSKCTLSWAWFGSLKYTTAIGLESLKYIKAIAIGFLTFLLSTKSSCAILRVQESQKNWIGYATYTGPLYKFAENFIHKNHIFWVFFRLYIIHTPQVEWVQYEGPFKHNLGGAEWTSGFKQVKD